MKEKLLTGGLDRRVDLAGLIRGQGLCGEAADEEGEDEEGGGGQTFSAEYSAHGKVLKKGFTPCILEAKENHEKINQGSRYSNENERNENKNK